jgi:hypothetical protein
MSQTKQTKTFDDLWLTVSTTDTHIDYIARPGAVWSDMEAWLENEWSGKHWRWRNFGGRVVVWRVACECDDCDEEEEEEWDSCAPMACGCCACGICHDAKREHCECPE